MPVYFPPVPQFPNGLDSDYSLFLVYNTTETILAVDNAPWSEDIQIVPQPANKPEIWANNGFGNISGEMFYYDAVDYDQNGKVTRLKRCARNLSGSPTQFNPAGTFVRSFVVAQHHNQLADSIALTEKFIGINFSADPVTLDYRIRQLISVPVLSDDYNCPEVDFSYIVITSDPAAGTVISYAISTNSLFNNFVLNFGDGTSTNSVAPGTHRYSPNTVIDPIVTFTSDNCQILQSPIVRPVVNPPTTGINPIRVDIQIPTVPQLPTISIQIPSLPQLDINLPGIIEPCITAGSINIPSLIIVEPPINIPSIINITPIIIPSNINITPISLPSIINIPPVSFIVPSLPNISITPATISFTDPNIPTTITFGSANVPNVISFAAAPVFPNIGFNAPPAIPNIGFNSPPAFSPVPFATPPAFSPIPFGSPPVVPVNWGTPPTVPVNWGVIPAIPLTINVQCGCCSSVTIPSTSTTGCCPYSLPPTMTCNIVTGTPGNTCVDFCVNNIITTNLSGGEYHYTNNWSGTTCQANFTLSCAVSSSGVNGFNVNGTLSKALGNGTSLIDTFNLSPVSIDTGYSTCGATANDFKVEFQYTSEQICPGVPVTLQFYYQAAMNLNSNLNLMDVLGLNNIQNISYGNLTAATPEMPAIRRKQSQANAVGIRVPEIPIIESNIPSVIKVEHEKVIPEKIALEAPRSIQLDASGLPERIPLVFPDTLPSMKFDTSTLPDAIKVIGIPESISLKVPESIKLEMPKEPIVEMVYKGAPIPISVAVHFDIQKVLSTEMNKNCVMLVPCS